MLQGESCESEEDLGISEEELKSLEEHTEEAAYLNFKRILLKAAENLESVHVEILGSPEFLEYPDAEIRAVAIRSLGISAKQENIESLLRFLPDPAVGAAAQAGLSRILESHSFLMPEIVKVFSASEDKVVLRRLAEVLAGKIEYFILRLSSTNASAAERLIRELLAMGKVSEILEFLKLNKDEELENKLLTILREEAAKNPYVETECRLNLSPTGSWKSAAMRGWRRPACRGKKKKNLTMIRSLYGILAASLLFSLSFTLWRGTGIKFGMCRSQNKSTFVVDFNFDFLTYSIVVNASYIVLLILSAFQVRSETRLWKLKTMSMLFKPKMLPSVSIIAPAYNEEKTIIQSANSLLNLKYDDYELVIVNDGSKDGTLKTLVEHFNLRRVDYRYVQHLKTSPVRRIFKNPLMPRLIVIDKMNGGKADSLNAGINIAQKEYFCGIDADSLLEPDALLKVAALTLDYGIETPAMGGNIFPINGCEVDKGYLDRLALPSNKLAALQTIEYLRAFMCGRLGWAKINSLLIISGAFGLFRRERVIAVGGYMSAQERFGKGTVGEDMELVVRIARLMREKKQKYRIGYAFNANCWTEVPESAKVLKRQETDGIEALSIYCFFIENFYSIRRMERWAWWECLIF